MSGDGSIMWTLDTMREAHGIDLDSFPVAILPYGTGNDQARVQGWGNQTSYSIYKNLEALTKQLVLHTREDKIDVWEFKMFFNEFGGFASADPGS